MSCGNDVDILQRTRAEDRVCITLDADFHSLLEISGERMSSVIRIGKEGLDASALAALPRQVWPGVEDARDDGVMVTIAERSVRVRRLPIVRS